MKEIGSKIGQKPTPTPNFCNFFSLSLPFQPLIDATTSSSATSSTTRSQHNYQPATAGLSLSLLSITLSFLLFSSLFLSPASPCNHHVFSGHTKHHQSGCQQHPQPRWTSSAIPAYNTPFVPFPSIRANKTWINSHPALLAFASSYRDGLDPFPA
jgi:hypothetical protein